MKIKELVFCSLVILSNCGSKDGTSRPSEQENTSPQRQVFELSKNLVSAAKEQNCEVTSTKLECEELVYPAHHEEKSVGEQIKEKRQIVDKRLSVLFKISNALSDASTKENKWSTRSLEDMNSLFESVLEQQEKLFLINASLLEEFKSEVAFHKVNGLSCAGKYETEDKAYDFKHFFPTAKADRYHKKPLQIESSDKGMLTLNLSYDDENAKDGILISSNQELTANKSQGVQFSALCLKKRGNIQYLELSDRPVQSKQYSCVVRTFGAITKDPQKTEHVFESLASDDKIDLSESTFGISKEIARIAKNNLHPSIFLDKGYMTVEIRNVNSAQIVFQVRMANSTDSFNVKYRENDHSAEILCKKLKN